MTRTRRAKGSGRKLFGHPPRNPDEIGFVFQEKREGQNRRIWEHSDHLAGKEFAKTVHASLRLMRRFLSVSIVLEAYHWRQKTMLGVDDEKAVEGEAFIDTWKLAEKSCVVNVADSKKRLRNSSALHITANNLRQEEHSSNTTSKKTIPSTCHSSSTAKPEEKDVCDTGSIFGFS